MRESSDLVVVRSARREDVEPVLGLWKRADAMPSVTDDVGSVGKLLDHPTSRLLIAESEGTIVGSVIAAWDGWRGAWLLDPCWLRVRHKGHPVRADAR